MSTERLRSLAPLRSAAWWLRMFEQCDVQYLALDPHQDRRLIQYVRAQPRWRIDLWDPEGVLFVRDDAVQPP